MDIVTQEDITMFSQMFSKLSNIIVQASEVGRELPQLRQEIHTLRDESETIRRRNQELDEELFNVRKQRDEAQAEAKEAVDDSLRQIGLRHELESKYQGQVNENTRLLTDLEAVRKERDDYGFRNMELQDQLDKANATLAKFRELLGNVSGASTPSPTVHEPSPTPTVILAEAPKTKRVYRTEDNATYDHEYYNNYRERKWDESKYDYYVEVAA